MANQFGENSLRTSRKLKWLKFEQPEVVKASLTRLENTFDEINTRNEISIRLSRLDDLFKEFERLDSNLSLEESELQEFEEIYFYLNAKFNDKLDKLNVQNQGEQASSKDCWLIYLLLQKIDPESRRLWAIKSSEEEFPNMKAFLDFLNGNETSQREGTSAETRNEASEFKGQAGESEIYSGASVNSELNLSFCPQQKIKKEKAVKFLFVGSRGVTAGQTKGCVDLVIGSQSSNERLEVNAFILNKVTSQIPSEFLDVKDLDYLKSIPLSDEEFES
ncbi:DUF1758 domain-containing protein [Trichonephila clavipes]|uniref:DUF1758 domain-containing protein n=1 Tax=Trichonephila clavipes TaxID=2585209 RepID=A0A8X7BHW3_TRICX|nr:DUF1758 domain-containing protein [Trichonephila clavipes]